jgi:hypothetical protein
VINDKGFCYLSDSNRPGRGLLIPLSSQTAIFGFVGTGSKFREVRLLIASTIRFINHALWKEAPREVYSHPSAETYLESIDREVEVNRWGPFRGISGGGLFE